MEDKGFRDFVQAPNPNYKLPERHTISKTLISSLFEECSLRCRESIKSCKRIALPQTVGRL